MSTQLTRRLAETDRGQRPAGGPLGAVGQWWGRHGVLLAVLATLGTHLLYVSRWLGADEGGFTMVAHFWRDPGAYLYGPLWVDRPPGLIGVFAVADSLGPFGPRLVVTAVAGLAVLTAADAATLLAGRRAGTWAAWAAFAFYCSALLEAQMLNGELVASTAVLLAMDATLRADRVASTRAAVWRLGLAAGAAAAAAALMKQSFVDGITFGVVLLGLRMVRGRRDRPGSHLEASALAAFLTGTSLTLVAVATWAAAQVKLDDLVYAVGGFRFDAARVLASWSPAAPIHRLQMLAVLVLVTGLGLLLLVSLASSWPFLRHPSPTTLAFAAAAAVEVVGIVAGGSYWAHYLIALVPVTVLTAGVIGVSSDRWTARWARRRGSPGTGIRGLVVAAVVVTVVTTPVAVAAVHRESAAATVGRWVGASARAGDSITVLYTHANAAQASGLPPAYPYAWSLPLRTLDPHLDLLVKTLEGQRAPTWVVQWDPLHYWGLDPHDRLEATLASHYREVGEVCGVPVLLQRGVDRRLAPVPGCSG